MLVMVGGESRQVNPVAESRVGYLKNQVEPLMVPPGGFVLVAMRTRHFT
jgi:hypothetical protein